MREAGHRRVRVEGKRSAKQSAIFWDLEQVHF